MNRTVIIAVWAVVLACVGIQPCEAQGHGDGGLGNIPDEVAAKLKKYDTPHYVIHTDLPAEKVREAIIRLNAMAREYQERTSGFAGSINKRLPVFLFSSLNDYNAAGGLVGSAGVYTGTRLMAVASEQSGDDVWRVLQHEGFHQFTAMVIGGRRPVWVNEGLAEYFGHGIWTGDAMVTGTIPRKRMARVKDMIRAGRLMGFVELLTMTQSQWNGTLSRRNYDQAWSMTHFLIHADGGKYRQAFGKFISDVASGRPWEAAFKLRFGRNTKAFEKSYSHWWLSLPDDPAPQAKMLATVQVLNSFLARASARKQSFKDFAEFVSAAKAGKLNTAAGSGMWLPSTLLEKALADAEAMKTWSLEKVRGRPQLVLTNEDWVFTGNFDVRGGKVGNVSVTVLRRPKIAKAGKSVD